MQARQASRTLEGLMCRGWASAPGEEAWCGEGGVTGGDWAQLRFVGAAKKCGWKHMVYNNRIATT